MKKAPRLYSNSYARWYEKQALKFTRAMFKSIEYKVIASLHRSGALSYGDSNIIEDANAIEDLTVTIGEVIDTWRSRVKEFADWVSNSQAGRIFRYVSRKFNLFGGKKKGKPRITPNVKATLDLVYASNYNLIVTIPERTLAALQSHIIPMVQSGKQHEIRRTIEHLQGATEYQVRRICRDQTAKAMEAVNQAECIDMGLEYYVWMTCCDERVSTGVGGHDKLHGKIFRYDRPEAIIDRYGNVGIPAQRVQCRCTSIGLFLEEGEKIVRDRYNYGYVVIDKNGKQVNKLV